MRQLRDGEGPAGDESIVSSHQLIRPGQTDEPPRFQLARITSEVGGGVYNWERLDVTAFGARRLAGAKTGTAREVNAVAGLTGNVQMVKVRGIWWFSAGGGSGGEFPAKIAHVDPLTSDPTVYQVDIYENGFSADPTQTSVTAYSVEDVSLNFTVGNEVSVYKAGGLYYVASSRPYAQVSTALILYGRLTSGDLGGGTYNFKETVSGQPGAAFVTGTPTLTLVERTGSDQLESGTDVVIFQAIPGEYVVFFPLSRDS